MCETLSFQFLKYLVAMHCTFLFKFIFGYVTCSFISKLDVYLYPVLAYFSICFIICLYHSYLIK